jgi:cephalosporin hydroxylase
MAVPDEPARLPPDEFKRLHQELDGLLTALRGPDGAGAHGERLQRRINEILKAARTRAERDWKAAQQAVNTMARTQVASALASRFLERPQPYKDDPTVSALIDEGLLHHAAFIQKSPSHLRFYRGLLAALDPRPRCLLEIGVKGGGSTAFWKALFPEATVVGLDVKLRGWLRETPSPDGVVYVQGDQTDVEGLAAIAGEYAPFDVIIDDGSHVTAHQATTLRTLLPHVRPGGHYVIEDVHVSVKKASTRDVDYGEDIWADFAVTAFQRLRRGPLGDDTEGARLARDLAPWIAELTFARQLLAIRAKARGEEA